MSTVQALASCKQQPAACPARLESVNGVFILASCGGCMTCSGQLATGAKRYVKCSHGQVAHFLNPLPIKKVSSAALLSHSWHLLSRVRSHLAQSCSFSHVCKQCDVREEQIHAHVRLWKSRKLQCSKDRTSGGVCVSALAVTRRSRPHKLSPALAVCLQQMMLPKASSSGSREARV